MKIKFKDGKLYVGKREFDFTRSKLAAAMKKGLDVSLNSEDVVLYLGAAHGYTPSFVADLVKFVFAVEFSLYVVKDLVKVCEKKKNLAPILADASKPVNYFCRISAVDVVYQDISQKSQVKIFLDNIDLYLKKGGLGLLAVKCCSIDVVASPESVFNKVKKDLEKHLKIVDYKSLEPYEKGHYFVICKKC